MSAQFQVLFQALGLTLVHFCWQGALIAAVAKLADMALPSQKPKTRYALSLGALIAMAGAAVMTFAYEQIRLSQVTVPVAPLPELPAAPLVQANPLTPLLPWLDAVWAGGVLLLSLRMLMGLWTIHRLSSGAVLVPEAVAARFARAVRDAGLRPVRIRMHPRIDGPFVVGLFRSVVYLPVSAVTTLSPDQLDAVLAHEIEHIRRADFAWNLLQTVLETLFFYHPAVWWLGRALREQRELCCDDAAVRSCDDPLTYATALLSLEEQRRVQPHLAMALNGNDRGPSLLSRIGRILGDTPMTSRSTPPSAARPVLFAVPLVLVTLAALAVPAAQVAANTAPAAKKQCNIKSPESVTPGNPAQAAAAKADDQDQASDESPAAEATDADVEPQNFWSGLMPKSSKPMKAIEGKEWKEKAEKINKEWKSQNWAWVKQAQDWASSTAGFGNQQDIQRANIDALRQAADETRRQAEQVRNQDARQADMLSEAAERMARNAEAMQKNIDAQAAKQDAMQYEIEAQARAADDVRYQTDAESRKAQAAARAAEAKVRARGDGYYITTDRPLPPEAPMPPAAPRAIPAPPAAPAAPAAPAPAPSPAAAPTPPSPPSPLSPVVVHLKPLSVTTPMTVALATPMVNVKVRDQVYKVTVKTLTIKPDAKVHVHTDVVVNAESDS